MGKKHYLACPRCGGELECLKTLPSSNRVRRVKQCKSCKQRFDTVERFWDDDPIKKLPVTLHSGSIQQHDIASHG